MIKQMDCLEHTDLLHLAGQMVNSTSRHIFLTGKAGTGKTTFLKSLAQSTHKKFVIVAPTGIAALNAGGVTIHSQFLLPIGSYHPDEHAILRENEQGRFFNASILARRNPLNSLRKQVLRDIDLLIIDEVSMLRADLLDAIDYRLRSARGNYREAFGGVQLLLIGDLFQLPPIVKEDQWAVLRKHYASAHFFSSLALKKEGYVYVELDKVFRQSDTTFIDLLNNLRNNCCTPADIEELNKHYRANVGEMKDIVTLTTHNRVADSINTQALTKLKAEAYNFPASVSGDFPESMYPLPHLLELKKGAQVMFVKNDTANHDFYNGKLATVVSLKSDEIKVQLADESRILKLEKMVWKNIKYGVDATKQLTEEEVGSFEQYPIKLAWAITVHKSQGLTFDRAIIDVGMAFAPGQVYVALSRLRSLNGLVLRTKINAQAISSDSDVITFQKSTATQAPLGEILQQGKAEYLQNWLCLCFDFNPLQMQLEYTITKTGGKTEFEDADMRNALPLLREKLLQESENTRKFGNQIIKLLREAAYEELQSRVVKASSYFLKFMFEIHYQILLHSAEAAGFSRVKAYLALLDELDQMCTRQLAQLQKAPRLTSAILNANEMEGDKMDVAKRASKREAFAAKIEDYIKKFPKKGASNKTGKKRKKLKAIKGATYQETFNLIKEGLTISSIATKRSLTEGTIEAHIAKGIASKKLSLKTLMDQSDIQAITSRLDKLKTDNLSDVYASFKGKYSYGQLRMVKAYLQTTESDENSSSS